MIYKQNIYIVLVTILLATSQLNFDSCRFLTLIGEYPHRIKIFLNQDIFSFQPHKEEQNY